MTNFTIHTQDTAPESSQEVLANIQKNFGFIPNLFGAFAESPAATEAYATIAGIFDKTDLSETERQVILMTNNRLNDCTYCMAAHTTISQMQKLSADVVESLRTGSSIADPKLEALRVFTVRVYEARGFVTQEELDAFFAAGYSKANVLDVILGTSFKVLSNYTNHIVETPLDDAFKPNAWTIDSSAAA